MKVLMMAAALAGAAPALAQAQSVAKVLPAPTSTRTGPLDMPTPSVTRSVPVAPHAARSAKQRYRRPRSAVELRVRAANRSATLEPAAAGYLNAVQVYPYGDGAIYHVFTAPGQVTDIALQPGEVLGAVAAGDTVRWIIGDTASGSGNTKRIHVLVKPSAPGLATNLIITTDRRAYHLALTSTTATAMAALSWTYPQDQLLALKVATDERLALQPIAPGLQIGQLNFNYSVSGDQPTWRPLRAFDDGRQTFIQFPASLPVGEAPPLFLVDAKGTASLVNYRVQGRYYVVDRLFEVAELRLGLKHQKVVRISRVDSADNRRGL